MSADHGLIPEARLRRGGSLPLCPACGSFADAPRRVPGTDRLDRWCRSCLRWCGSGGVLAPRVDVPPPPVAGR